MKKVVLPLLAIALIGAGSYFLMPKYKGKLTHEILENPELFQQYIMDRRIIYIGTPENNYADSNDMNGFAKELMKDEQEYLKFHPEDETLMSLNMQKALAVFSFKANYYSLLRKH